MQKIGFIGVGHLADFMIRGFRRGGWKGEILLAPRSLTVAQKLVVDCDCQIVEDSQQMIDNLEMVCLTVRPAQVADTLSALQFNANQTLLSFVAGLPIASLRESLNAELEIIRAMPISAAEVCASPTMMFPANSQVAELLDCCGKGVLLNHEQEFEAGTIISCVYASFLALYAELVDNCAATGLDKKLARQLIYGTFEGAATVAAEDLDVDAMELAKKVAAPGTFSKLALDHLQSKQAFQPWHESITLLNNALSAK